MKKFIALLLAAVLCLGLTAFGAEPEEPAGQETTVNEISEDAVLKVAIPEEPDFLLPTYGNPTVADTTVIACMFDTLFVIDENNVIKPCVAESYEWVDPTHLKVTIRKGITAYDGTELNANDVYFSLKSGLEGNYGEMYYISYINLEETKVEDDYTIIIGTPEPDSTFLYILCDIPFHLIDESSVEANGGIDASALNPLCGTGRYVLSSWVPGQYIELTRNENYWGGLEDCYYKTIRFTWVTDTASRALNVRSGDVDVAVDLGYADVAAMIGSDDVTILSAAAPRSCTITFNCADGLLFNNEKLREAVCYATNVDDLAYLLYADFADPIVGPVPTSVAYYIDQLDKLEYNPEKAKAALAEAGYPDGFSFSLVVEPGAGYDAVAELMQAQLLEVGINMAVDKVELIDYFGKVAPGLYDAYIGTLSCGSAKTFLNQCDGRLDYFQSLGGTAFFSDEMNAAVDQAKSTDEAEAMEGLHKVQELAFDNHLYIGVSSFVNITAVKADITNYKRSGFGYTLVYTLRPAE